MLICYDCEKEIRNEYLNNISKQNRLRNIIEEQHSNIKRKLMNDDNISRSSKESFYTDNNSYNPTSKRYKKNMRELESSLNKRDSGNLVIDTDKLSIHSYNGIITDYSKRRKKNKIRNDNNVNKESNHSFSNIKNERKYDEKNGIEIDSDVNNMKENKKNKRISHNINNEDDDNNLNNNSSKYDENDSNYNERHNEEKNIDNYLNNKNNNFNKRNSNENYNNEMNINNFNKVNNENINRKSGSLINQNNNIEFNNIIRHQKNDNLSEHSKNSLNIPEKNNNIFIQEKNENVLGINSQSEYKNNSPFIPQEKNESNDKRKKYTIYNENNCDLYESNSKKNISNDNESKSETDDIHKSIYYEKNENYFNGESKYIRKDKIKRNKKGKSKSKDKKTNYKNNINFHNKQVDIEIEKENSENTSDNNGQIIFKNKYVDSEKNEINNFYEENNRIDSKRILYQDFYFREVSFSSSSSVKNSIISDSKYDEDNNDSRKSYPEDRKNNECENCINEINEPKEEFDKFIFDQINILRANPKSFVQKIESSKKNIGVDKRNNYIYNGSQKILLNNGIYAFENTIRHLNVLRSMNKLNYDPKFNIKLPSNEEEINDRKYQNNKVNELLENKIKIKSFWREVIRDPEECFLLMVVDDCGNNCGFKRKDLLDPNMTSIGIRSIKLGKYFACYIQLGKK